MNSGPRGSVMYRYDRNYKKDKEAAKRRFNRLHRDRDTARERKRTAFRMLGPVLLVFLLGETLLIARQRGSSPAGDPSASLYAGSSDSDTNADAAASDTGRRMVKVPSKSGTLYLRQRVIDDTPRLVYNILDQSGEKLPLGSSAPMVDTSDSTDTERVLSISIQSGEFSGAFLGSLRRYLILVNESAGSGTENADEGKPVPAGSASLLLLTEDGSILSIIRIRAAAIDKPITGFSHDQALARNLAIPDQSVLLSIPIKDGGDVMIIAEEDRLYQY